MKKRLLSIAAAAVFVTSSVFCYNPMAAEVTTQAAEAVEAAKVESLEISGGIKTIYYYGEEFSKDNLTVTAKYDDGSSEVITDYKVDFDNTALGEQQVCISKDDVEAYITVEVRELKAKSLTLDYMPAKTTYKKDCLFRVEGLQATVTYNNGSMETLDAENLTITVNDKEIADGDAVPEASLSPYKCIVKMKDKDGTDVSEASCSFYITVDDVGIKSLTVEPPAKTKYYKGETFDTAGMQVTAEYDDGSKEALKANEYKVSGFSSTKEGENEITVESVGTKAVAKFNVEIAQKQAVGMSIENYPRTTYNVGDEFDPSDMVVDLIYDSGDSAEVKDYTVDTTDFDSSKEGTTKVVVSTGEYTAEIPITIKNMETLKWRKSVFGQSSGYDKQEKGSTGVKAENYGTTDGTINVRAWDGCGKITNDHDGMTYYYTSVDSKNNFKLSADVKVNKYLEHDNDDTKRNGQEAFGIMAKDVVPLKGTDGSIVTSSSAAEKDAEGIAVPQEGSSVFASNMVIVGGYSGAGWPSDGAGADYEKYKTVNRINMLVRTGVTATDGGGTRIGPDALSSTFPKEGNTYHLTLERVNGGLYAKCLDYQTGEVKESYYYDDDLLTVQNKDEIYVGFFAARWADIDVSNVDFYESVRTTDRSIEKAEDEVTTPSVSVTGASYTTNTNYTFKVEPVDSKGRVTISLNGVIIAQDEELDSEKTYSATLDEDQKNTLVVLYQPDELENYTSYDTVVTRQTIYNKSNYDASAPVVYVSPKGKFQNSGTKDSPFDIDTAVGFLQNGQTAELAGGTYYRNKEINIPIGTNGAEDAYRTIKAADGEQVVLNFLNASAGVVLGGNYWVIDGIDFTNCGANLKCFHLGGSNCVVSNCKFYGNRDMGLQISRVLGSAQPDIDSWPSNNTIIDCESYNNCDPSMINADGFAAKLTVGYGNKFVNCSSHNNVDDGWDLYTKVNSGAIGPVTLENCVSYHNGWRLNSDGTETPYGAGGNNGFKCGGENVGVAHELINCVAYGNGNNGITTNSNPMLKLTNVKSYDNAGCNIRLYSDKPENYDYTVNGVISYNGGTADIIGTVNKDEDYANNSDTPITSDINFYQLNEDEPSKNLSGVEATREMLN